MSQQHFLISCWKKIKPDIFVLSLYFASRHIVHWYGHDDIILYLHLFYSNGKAQNLVKRIWTPNRLVEVNFLIKRNFLIIGAMYFLVLTSSSWVNKLLRFQFILWTWSVRKWPQNLFTVLILDSWLTAY